MNSVKTEPLILEIKGNSLDDGPGVRSVVFFKGCPLSCVWCHNPESKRAVPEIAFDRTLCTGCGACVDACGEGALKRKRKEFIDRSRCTLCFRCTGVCPSGALARVGKKMSVQEIVDIVLRDEPFFKTSGGGVTLSGGEPTLYMDFASALLRALKKKKINTLIETCGFFDYDRFAGLVLPYVNTIYYDIKIIDDADHRRHAGASNVRILANFKKLKRDIKKTKIELLPRVPLVPGITDTETNLRGIAAFLAGEGVRRSSLMRYNPLWHEKAEKLGIRNSAAAMPGMKTWDGRGHYERCREIFLAAGIDV